MRTGRSTALSVGLPGLILMGLGYLVVAVLYIAFWVVYLLARAVIEGIEQLGRWLERRQADPSCRWPNIPPCGYPPGAAGE